MSDFRKRARVAAVLLLLCLGVVLPASSQENSAPASADTAAKEPPNVIEGRLALCAGRVGEDQDRCREACKEGWPASTYCIDWRRFGDVGADLLASAKKRDDAIALEAAAIAKGMSAEDARNLRWYATVERHLIDRELLPKVDMADAKMRGHVDNLFEGPIGFEISAGMAKVGKYQKSAEVYGNLFESIKKELGARHYRVMRLALTAGKYTFYAGDRIKALEYFSIASRAADAVLPAGHPWRAEANLYHQAITHLLDPPRGDLAKMEQSQRALDEVFGRGHERANFARQMFGRALIARGDVNRARAVLFHAQRELRHTSSDSNPYTAHAYVNFAHAALLAGELFLARVVLYKAEVLLKEFHDDRAAGMVRYYEVHALQNRLWSKEMGGEEDLAAAEKSARMAIWLMEQQLGKENPSLAPYYQELSLIRREAGDPKGAVTEGIKGLKLTNGHFNSLHPQLLESLSHHLALLVSGNLPEKAIETLSLVIDPLESCCKHSALLRDNYNVMMRAFHMLGKKEEARQAGERSLELWREDVWSSMVGAQDNLRVAFLLVSAYNTLHHVLTLQEDARARLETLLSWQGIGVEVARAQKRRRRQIESLDAPDRAAFDAWEGHRIGEALLTEEELATHAARLDKLGIARVGAPPAKRSMDDVCAALKARDAWLVNYHVAMRADAENSRLGSLRGDIVYTVYALGPDCKLHYEELGKLAEVEGAIKAWRQTVTDAQDCYEKKGSPYKCLKEFAAMDAASGEVYTRSFAPIHEKLRGAKRLLIVPDKALATFSFDALVEPKTNRYLVQDHQIDLLPSPGALLEPEALAMTKSLASSGKKRKKKARGGGKRSALIVGDIDYSASWPSLESAVSAWQKCSRGGCDADLGQAAAKEFASKVERVSLRGGQSVANCGVGVKWAPLRTEARAVAEILGAKFTGAVTLVTGDSALEPLVANAMKSQQIIHIATHGFFAASGDCHAKLMGGDIFEAFERALETGASFVDLTRHSSIVLSGAEHTATREGSSVDGLLDGGELGALDLSQTELLTLSACETGIGVEFSGDGVHALSRAFLEAGAQRVVASLWQVPSQPTSALFIDLYTTYAAPKSSSTLEESFRQAKLAAIERAKKAGIQNSAFLWGAFPMLVTR